MINFLRKQWILLLILVICVGARSYKLTSPLIEYHSWRQADTAAVARNFARNGINLLVPRYDDLSSLQSGIANPQGYRMVEFPIYNALIALTNIVVPQLSIVEWGRIWSIISACVVLWCLYHLTKRAANEWAAIIASIVFATFPFFVFYTRAILPETFGLALVMISVYAISTHVTTKRLVISSIFFSAAVLVKPTIIFFGLILLITICFDTHRPLIRRLVISGTCFVLAILPVALWRVYIQSYPEGIPASAWLITSVNTGGSAVYIFFRPAFFRWMFYERLNLLILGSFALPLTVVGTLRRSATMLPIAMLISSVVYICTFQGGNVQHEYYQILILPTIALFTGMGASFMYEHAHGIIGKLTAGVLIVGLLIGGWIFSWDKVHHYYYSLSDIPQFATIVQTFVRPDEKIVVDTAGDTTALYAFDRMGSPGLFAGATDLKAQGYSYIFTYNLETAKNLQIGTTARVISASDRYVLLKL
ncbi:MAG: glycosyltransferase family 39 protein [Candidatus Roizmanbacteria bacterium]